MRKFLIIFAAMLTCTSAANVERSHSRDLSLEELTAKLDMELIPEHEWRHSPRRLFEYSVVSWNAVCPMRRHVTQCGSGFDCNGRTQYIGSNCWDVTVTEPYGISSGEYHGVGDRTKKISPRGPTFFTDNCFEGYCGDQVSALSRRMFLARAFRCPEGQQINCSQEEMWGVYSAITNSTTGENRLGFLRSWAEGALHPVDVNSDSGWWTFEHTNVDQADSDNPPECERPDCLIPVSNVRIDCAPDSPNWTLPPSPTPYPTMTPITGPTDNPLPANAPPLTYEFGDFADSGDLNKASRGATPSLWFAAEESRSCRVCQGIGFVATVAGWLAAGRLA